MAKGRMLNWSVTESMKFHRLPDDTCRLMATWTISLLDAYGVFHADPVLVKSRVFPMRADVSVEQVGRYLDAMETAGLIYRFEVDGRRYQFWPGFKDNQPRLHQEREGKSGFPPPPELPKVEGATPVSASAELTGVPEEVQSQSGNTPPQSNISESKGDAASASSPDFVHTEGNTTIANGFKAEQKANTMTKVTKGTDGVTDFFMGAAAANDSRSAHPVISRWRGSENAKDICLMLCQITGLKVTNGDSGKWLKGAAHLYELGVTRAILEKVWNESTPRDKKFLTHPEAFVSFVRAAMAEVPAPSTPADPDPYVGWEPQPDGSMRRVRASEVKA